MPSLRILLPKGLPHGDVTKPDVLVSPRPQVSMFNDEIFIIGKPPILLHSKDAGKSWERVPLSPKVSRPK